MKRGVMFPVGMAKLNQVSLALSKFAGRWRQVVVAVSPFTPSQLFASGEEGVWFDVSDFGRYMGDLGPELVINGTFDTNTTGWSSVGTTYTSTAVSSGGKFVVTSGPNGYGAQRQSVTLTVGKTYLVTCALRAVSGSTLSSYFLFGTTSEGFGVAHTAINSTTIETTYRGTITATQAQYYVIVGNHTASTDAVTEFDNISVRELTSISTATLFQDAAGTTPVTAVEQPVGRILDKSGRSNHATQTISTARPTLRARYNLLLNSAVLATQSVTTLATGYTLKFSGAGSITLSGTKTGTYTAGTHTLTGVTAGTLTLTVSGSVTTAQLTTVQYASLPYQAITSATSYDADPVKFPTYLYFDGVDDFMTLGDVLDLRLNNLTILVVGRNDSSNGSFIAKAVSTANPSRFGLFTESGLTYHTFSASSSPAGYSVTRPAQIGVTRILNGTSLRSGTLSLQINNDSAVTTPTINDTGDFNSTYRCLLGAYGNSTDTGQVLLLSGLIYQICVVMRTLTTQETTDTKTYLATKTSITL